MDMIFIFNIGWAYVMVVLIGISGPTNSGKTYFAKKLNSQLMEKQISCELITTDEFYLERSHQSYEERTKVNYDIPSSIDQHEFQRVIKLLSEGKDVKIPVYDYTIHNRTSDTRMVEAVKVIIVEGIFAFSFDKINSYYTLKIYVDYDSDVRLIRRIQRDTIERGRTIDSIVSQYINTVKPSQSEHVENDKNKADMVIRGNHDHSIIFQLILSYVLNQSNT
ncbi:MAG: uridine kinase [Candidatus Kariarchaeaceae archaeon]|jgi:uridine kinase